MTDWPTEAREIVARHMQRGFEPRSYALAQADKLLAALVPHVQPHTDDCVIVPLAALKDLVRELRNEAMTVRGEFCVSRREEETCEAETESFITALGVDGL